MAAAKSHPSISSLSPLAMSPSLGRLGRDGEGEEGMETGSAGLECPSPLRLRLRVCGGEEATTQTEEEEGGAGRTDAAKGDGHGHGHGHGLEEEDSLHLHQQEELEEDDDSVLERLARRVGRIFQPVIDGCRRFHLYFFMHNFVFCLLFSPGATAAPRPRRTPLRTRPRRWRLTWSFPCAVERPRPPGGGGAQRGEAGSAEEWGAS